MKDEKEKSPNAKLESLLEDTSLPRKTKNRVGGFPFVGC